jgi:inosine-uridine nucleoside N-ribohydrolase
MHLPLLLALLLAAPAAARERVVFDTDSGVFGDDGAALVMMARSPQQVELAGVTIVPGNVWPRQGAEYMLNILRLLHHPQTVYAGTEAPLVNSAAMARESERRWGPLEYIGAFAHDPDEVKPAPSARLSGRKAHSLTAVQFLINQVEHHPGEVTILALGPMTNVALALTLKPGIATLIKQIVFMGGNVKVPGNATKAAEFNFWFDPEAARIVLRSRIPKKVMFALDICNRAPVRKIQFDQIVAAKTPITELFAQDLGRRYPGFYKNPDATAYMWDSLAAGWLLDPGFVTSSRQAYLDVQSGFGVYYGATTPLDRRLAPQATPVTVMADLDAPRAWDLFRALLTRAQ